MAVEKTKVLFVDDEADILYTLKRSLEIQGFSVDTFKDAERAISDFKPNHYDIILFDVRMPCISGFDLARLIWREDPNARICFMTAFEIYEHEAKRVFKNLDGHCFIKKPITGKQLAEHIQKRLQR